MHQTGDADDDNEGVQELVQALFKDSIVKLVLDAVEKLDEDKDEEKQGVFNALSLLGVCTTII